MFKPHIVRSETSPEPTSSTVEIAKIWMDDLENEPEFYAMRVFQPADGGYVWRNKVHRDHFERYGFFPSQTIPWAGVVSFFNPLELERLELIYLTAFQVQRPVRQMITIQSPSGIIHDLVTFEFIHGNLSDGVMLTHSQSS